MAGTSLIYRYLDEALVLPFEHPAVAPPPRGFRGGVVVREKEYEALRQTRYRKPVDTFAPDAEPEIRLDGDYAYGGLVYHHFGHLMSELVHRILPVRDIERNPRWIFANTRGSPNNEWAKLPDVAKEIYGFLGVDPDRVTIITRNACIGTLLVTQAGSDFGTGPHEFYLEMLDRHSKPKLAAACGDVARPKRLYVSRSDHRKFGGLLGEKCFENALEAEGYFIFRPERYSLIEQMDFYSKADVVIFLEGSACHGVELLGRAGMKHCLLLNRRPGEPHMFSNAMRPRSERFDVFSQNLYLGTAFRSEGGHAQSHLGTSLLDVDAAIGFLRNSGAASMEAFSKDRYFEAARADLMGYLLEARGEGNAFRAGEDVKSLLNAFAQAING